MNLENVSQRIKTGGIIAILRGGFTVDDMLRVGDALLHGGVTVMEATLNSPHALTALPKLVEHFGERMLVGAGTVRDLSQARRATDAGAQFLVSPNLDLETVSFARTKDVLHLPGIFTATEAQTAFAAGCRMLKLFPMDGVSNGANYLKALCAPLNDIEFVPTGGISLENIAEYARAGAVAVGLGGKLVGKRDQSSHEITTQAKLLREAWEESRHG